MATMMDDFAGGSDAVRLMQRNIYGAQYDQQNIAADAEKKQLDNAVEKQRIKANDFQQAMTESGYKASEEAKAKIAQLSKSKEFLAKPVYEQMNEIAVIESSVNPEKANTLFKASSDAALKDEMQEARKQQRMSNNLTSLSNASRAIPEERLGEFFDQLPAEGKAEIAKRVGQANWDKMSPTEKRDTLSGIFTNAAQQVQREKLVKSGENVKILADARIEVAKVMSNRKSAASARGDTETVKRISLYEKKTGDIDSQFNRAVKSYRDSIVKEQAAATEARSAAKSAWFPSSKNAQAEEHEQAASKHRQDMLDLATDSNRKKIAAAKEILKGSELELALKNLNEEKQRLQIDLQRFSGDIDTTRDKAPSNQISPKPTSMPTPTQFDSQWKNISKGQGMWGPDGKYHVKQ